MSLAGTFVRTHTRARRSASARSESVAADGLATTIETDAAPITAMVRSMGVWGCNSSAKCGSMLSRNARFQAAVTTGGRSLWVALMTGGDRTAYARETRPEALKA
jgi:hypothetical protein